MRIRTLEEIGAGAWNAAVAACPDGSFFHRAEWAAVIATSFGFAPHWLAVEDGSGIAGVLPLFAVRRGPLGTALMSTPLCVTGGAAALDGGAAATLERAALARALELRVDYVEFRNGARRLEGWRTHEQFHTFTRPVLGAEDRDFRAIPKRQRAEVRKGIALGLTTVVTRDIEPFYSLFAHSMHRMGTPAYPRRYIEALLSAFAERAEFLVTVLDDRPQCAMLCFHFDRTLLPYYAGASDEAYSTHAYTFTLWSAVRRALELGYDAVNFGRSIRGTGSFDFKKNWGMEAQPLNYQTRLVAGRSHPVMDPASLRFRAFSGTWKRLPRVAVDALSPLASRLVV